MCVVMIWVLFALPFELYWLSCRSYELRRHVCCCNYVLVWHACWRQSLYCFQRSYFCFMLITMVVCELHWIASCALDWCVLLHSFLQFKHELAARTGKGKEDRIINEWAAHFKVKPDVVRDGWEQCNENDSKHYEKIRDTWAFLQKMHQPISNMKRVFS